MRRILFSLFAVAIAVAGAMVLFGDASTVLAQGAQPDVFGVQEVGENLPLGGGDIRVIVINIIRVALSLLGIAAVLIVLYGGFVYMTAQGDAEKIGQARKILVNGTIGLAIILSSFAIVQFIFSSLQGAIIGDNPGNNGGNNDPVVGCDDLGGCNEGNPNVCLEREQLFVVESLTPSTPSAQDNTNMSNVVVRAVFSQDINGEISGEDVLGLRVNNVELVPDEVNYLSNSVVELRFYQEDAACDAYEAGNDGDREPCLASEPGRSFEIFVKDGITSAQGRRLQERTVCGDFPTETRFTIGEERIDKQPPVIESMTIDGQAGNDIVLQKGQAYDIAAQINDRGNGRQFGGVGMARIRIRQLQDDNTIIDTWEKYFGPSVADGSSGVFSLSRNVRFGNEFAVPARYQVELQALDTDSNNTIETMEVVLVGDSCANGIQDAGEEDIDVGGQCLGDGMCQEDWQCRSQKCVNNQCLAWPTISDISDTSGAAGNLVTIAGQFFGQDQGQVYFGVDANNDGLLDDGQEWVLATATACGGIDTWHDDVIIAQVPSNDVLAEGTRNIIRVVRSDDPQASDTTRDDHGPLVSYFEKNNVVLPGLCSVETIDTQARAALAGTPVRAIGVNLGNGQNSTVRFGGVQVGYDQFTPNQVDTVVPDTAGVGRVAVTITRSGVMTNGVPFTILDAQADASRGPIVRAVSPTRVTPGSLVTIQGEHFGNQTGLVYVTTNPNESCRTANGAVRDGCIRLALDLPGQCGINWKDREIIAVVPNNLDFEDVAQQLGESVIQDGTMEAQDLSAWSQYSRNPGLEVFEKSADIQNEGAQSLHLVRQDNQVAGIIQRNIPVTPGATYRFSLDYLQQAQEGSIGVVFRTSDGVNNLQSNTVGQARQNNWERLSYEFVVPQGEETLMFFVTTKGDVYLDDIRLQEVLVADEAVGNYTVVVEDANQQLSNADTSLQVIDGAPLPGICRLSPAVGPAPLAQGEQVTVSGVNFTNGLTAFFYGRGSLVQNMQTWLQTTVNNGISAIQAQEFSTVIPVDEQGYSMQTGPIRVQTDAGISNPITYTVQRCTDPGVDSPGEGFQCCETGPDAGLFIPTNQVCRGETRDGAYMYRFSTGQIPDVPVVLEQCSQDTWYEPQGVGVLPSPTPWRGWENGSNACINRTVSVQFSTDMDETTINNGTVQLYRCPANEDGVVSCDEQKELVPIDPTYVQRQLVVWSGEQALLPYTTYRVELSQDIQSYRIENIAGQDTPLRAPLVATRPCGDGTAYCFEFSTGGPQDQCVLEDVFISPQSYIADRLGLLISGGRSPLYYVVHGKGNQLCSLLPVDGLGWNWQSQDPFLANVQVAPSLGNSSFIDRRATVEALQETAPNDVIIQARADIGDGTRDFLTIAGVPGSFDARVQGPYELLADPQGEAFNFGEGDTVTIDFTYDDHNGDTTGFAYNEEQGVYTRRQYILRKNQAYTLFVDEAIYEDERPSTRVLKFNMYCDGFNACSEPRDNANPTGFSVPLLGDSNGQERITLVFGADSLTAYRGNNQTFIVNRPFAFADVNNQNDASLVLGGFTPEDPAFEGLIRQLRVTKETTSYVATSSLVIDLGEPGVLNYFPFCTDSCANATIGLTFTRSMAPETFAQGFSLRACQDETCAAFVGEEIDLLPIPQESDRVYKVQPATPLQENTWYLATATSSIYSVAKQAENGNDRVLGKPIQPFSWKFRTKMQDGLCVINTVDVVPDSYMAQSIGEKTVYAAIPKSLPNQCNAIGQELNPWGYGWDWQVGDESVATITAFEGFANQSAFCSEQCTLLGTDIARSSYDAQEDYPICGNGVVDAGEDCDIAGFYDPEGALLPGNGGIILPQMVNDKREIPGQSCSYQCLRPGNDTAYDESLNNEQNSCGNGVVDWKFGEECDPNDPQTGAFCTDRCLRTGATAQSTGDVAAPICGSGTVTAGEDCDGGQGCSAQCTHTGTALSQAWCDLIDVQSEDEALLCRQAISVCGNGTIESGEACEVGVNGATEQTCSDRCLVQQACGTPLEQCELGTPGCSDQCTLLGSSVVYPESAICGDGVVGSGEVAICEIQGQQEIGQNPVQIVTAVGEGENVSDDTYRQETTITAQARRVRTIVDGDVVVQNLDAYVDTAQYALQCGFEEYLTPLAPASFSVDTAMIVDGDMQANGTNAWTKVLSENLVVEKVDGILGESEKSLYIVSDTIGEQDLGGVSQENIAIQSDTTYQLSFRYRLDRGSADVYYRLGQEPGALGKTVSVPEALSIQQQGEFTTYVTSDGNDRLFDIFFRVGFGSVLYIDDVSLIEVADAPLTYNNCPNNGDNTSGVAYNSCCYARPMRQAEYPVDGTGLQGDRRVCRNTQVMVEFSQTIDEQSVADHVMLAAGYTAEEGYTCGDGEQDVTNLVQTTFEVNNANHIVGNMFQRVFRAIKQFFVRLFAGDVFARGITPPEDIAVWCADTVSYTTQVFAQNEGEEPMSKVQLDIAELLDADRTYAVLLRGGRGGIKTVTGVGMVSPEPADMGGEQIHPTLDAFVFRTRDTICHIDTIEVEPAQALFSTPNEDREFIAIAKNTQGEAIVPTVAYDWDWEWGPTDNAIFTLPVAPAQTSTVSTVIASNNVEGSMTAIVAARITNDTSIENNHTGRSFFGTSQLSAVFCERPWPSRENYPYNDASYNLSFAYCADAGQSGVTTDDLPFLIEQPLDLVGDNDQLVVLPGTLKRTIFFNDKNDDVIGLQISANPNHLSLQDWYQYTFGASVPSTFQVTSVSGYQALTNGTTYYVQALNEDRNSENRPIYNNVYIFSISNAAQQSTLAVYELLMDSLQFNTNMTDLGYCQTENAQSSEDITSISCVSDFSCQEPDGRALEGTNGQCSQDRTKLYRDWNRLRDIDRMQTLIQSDVLERGQFPRLQAGTFVPGYSNSQWGSWNNALGQTIGALPRDPVNQWSSCDERDGQTCWDQESATLLCPRTAQIYEYSVDNDSYTIHAQFEYLDIAHPFVRQYIDLATFSTDRWCTPLSVHSPFDGICGDGIVNGGEQCDPAGSSQVVNIGYTQTEVTPGQCAISATACTDAARDCGYVFDEFPIGQENTRPAINSGESFCGYENENGERVAFINETQSLVSLGQSLNSNQYVQLYACQADTACTKPSTYENSTVALMAEQVSFESFDDFQAHLVAQNARPTCYTIDEFLGDDLAEPQVQQCIGRGVVPSGNVEQCAAGEYATQVCNSSCEYEPGICLAAAQCGNGIVEQGEVCDAGQNNGLYGRCSNDCQSFGEAGQCGDGIFDAANEQCEVVDQLYATSITEDGGIARAIFYSDRQRNAIAQEKCALFDGAEKTRCESFIAGVGLYDVDVSYRCENDPRYVCNPDNANSCLSVQNRVVLGAQENGIWNNYSFTQDFDIADDEYQFSETGDYYFDASINPEQNIENLGACLPTQDIGSYGMAYNQDQALTCGWNCIETGAYCGDGVVDYDQQEQCDDRNSVSGDGCSDTCQIENLACKDQAPFVRSQDSQGRPIVQVIPMQLGNNGYTIDACYQGTTPAQICRAYGLVCHEEETSTGVSVSCDDDLSQRDGTSGAVLRINCLGEYDGQAPIVSGQIDAPLCGNGTIDQNEQCDAGDDNGQVCTPSYGNSCAYCSDRCQTVTVDPLAYCGNGVLDQGEVCDTRADGTVLSVRSDAIDNVYMCSNNPAIDDTLNAKGTVQCTQQCQAEVFNCFVCGRDPQTQAGLPIPGVSPRVSLVNPLGRNNNWEAQTTVTFLRRYAFYPVDQGNGLALNPFGLSATQGYQAMEQRRVADVMADGKLFDDDNNDGFPGDSNDTITSDGLCTDQYQLVFNEPGIANAQQSIGSIAQAAFAYTINPNSRLTDNEYVVNPSVPPGFMRAVIRWTTQDNEQVILAGNLYNERLSDDDAVEGRVSYLDLFDPDANATRLCNSFEQQGLNIVERQQPGVFTDAYRVQNYWLPNKQLPCAHSNDTGGYDYFFTRSQTSPSGNMGIQSVTVDLEKARGEKNYAFFVSAISADAANIRRIPDFRNSNVTVDVYLGNDNPQAIAKPTYTFKLQEAFTGQVNRQAKYWHVFNLVVQPDGTYALQTQDTNPLANDGSYHGTIETDFCQVRKNVEAYACN